MSAVSGLGGYFGSGGVSLYKSEKTTTKAGFAELVLVKAEFNIYQAPNARTSNQPADYVRPNQTQAEAKK